MAVPFSGRGKGGIRLTRYGMLVLEIPFQGVAKERIVMAKKSKTTTFVLELPLVVEPGAAKRVRAHLEAARQLFNAILSEGQRRLRLMRADPSWQAAPAIPHAQKHERQATGQAKCVHINNR